MPRSRNASARRKPQVLKEGFIARRRLYEAYSFLAAWGLFFLLSPSAIRSAPFTDRNVKGETKDLHNSTSDLQSNRKHPLLPNESITLQGGLSEDAQYCAASAVFNKIYRQVCFKTAYEKMDSDSAVLSKNGLEKVILSLQVL
eukprot:TRINITY_DN5733_c0_g1_i1.p1 TRINITY_DN5733_c0_g1~~TRINITY_DN5733_c0_g1_i1.p1  ORF type:complete len:143 (+),score=14.48 TRINITY_DN5733_c0_g1_i1:212-640(+)